VTGVDGTAARALAFQRRTAELVADEFAPISEGWLVRSRSMPLVWSVNQVCVTRPVRFAAALALSEEHLGELPYRQLAVEHEPSGRRLEGPFRDDGWEIDRDLTMVLAQDPDRQVDTGAVIEPGERETLALTRRWADEDEHLQLTPEGLAQVVEHNRLTWRVRRARRLGVRDNSGALAAITQLYSDGTSAQVEGVYTVPEQRGRGYARALVTHAVALAQAAGHKLTFIVADDMDWPKQLYARIGFEPVGRAWLFHRQVGR
jgi:GNAT superfamily N-acetyltransferase